MSDEIEQDSVQPEAPVSEPTEPQVSSAPTSEPAAVQSTPWDAFKSLPQFQGKDDRAIASNLYQALQREEAASRALRQYQSILPVAQEYMTYRPEFEKWRAMQQQQAQAPAPEKPKWWNPPEVKDTYRRYLIKDEAGRDAIAPNAPYEAQQALTEWMNYRADFAQKFLTNPGEALGPFVAEMAQQKAQELIQQTLEQRDRESYVSQFEKENADWLFDQQTGSVSPEGAAFHKYVEQARELGLPPGQQRADYATAMVELDLLRGRYQSDLSRPQAVQAPPAQPPVQAAPEPPVQQPAPDRAKQNMDYLRREASRNPSRSAGTTNNDPRQPRPQQTFEQMLAENLRAANIIQ
jgi:hypothetical protein